MNFRNKLYRYISGCDVLHYMKPDRTGIGESSLTTTAYISIFSPAIPMNKVELCNTFRDFKKRIHTLTWMRSSTLKHATSHLNFLYCNSSCMEIPVTPPRNFKFSARDAHFFIILWSLFRDLDTGEPIQRRIDTSWLTHSEVHSWYKRPHYSCLASAFFVIIQEDRVKYAKRKTDSVHDDVTEERSHHHHPAPATVGRQGRAGLLVLAVRG